MYFVDSQRTLTRRESSLISPRYGTIFDETIEDTITTFRSTNILNSESATSINIRKVPARKELVTILYDSMVKYVVESWEVIKEPKKDFGDMMNNLKTQSFIRDQKRKKTASGGKTNKTKRTRSKQDFSDIPQFTSVSQSMMPAWKTFPDERAVIRFKNGNIYEGSISMKRRHGEGRLQWVNGTIYIGKFKENAITGRGKIFWNDDKWYEGEFVDNVIHGRGLYVDSRQQQCYYGDWARGVRQGRGTMYYDGTFQNFYDGEWDNNVRHGYGCRQYNHNSGYRGYWFKDVRDGEGLMIWPNQDVYKGQWENGAICGQGKYIWQSVFNNTITPASLVSYKGDWKFGERCGTGILDLGLDGARYEGEFSNNKKHGSGTFVTNTGTILDDKELFVDDNLVSMESLCDTTLEVSCHVKLTFSQIKDDDAARSKIIQDYFRNNQIKTCTESQTNNDNLKVILKNEEYALKKALDNYLNILQNIYLMYSNINNDKVNFKPVLIRLYLWQLYNDCNLIEKGVTLVDIDNMFHANPEWLSKNAHDPFEKLYFWQFIHSLISVALKIYLVKYRSSSKNDMLGKAFRCFMDNDILPRIGEHKGVLTTAYLKVLPLKSLYSLFYSIGEPLSLCSFLRAVRYPGHDSDGQPPLIDNKEAINGQNLYGLESTVQFISDQNFSCGDRNFSSQGVDLKLFNFGNLSTTTIIKEAFSVIFPQIFKEKILNLDVEMTFFEFLELIIICAELSIKQQAIEESKANSSVSYAKPTKIKY